MHDDTGSVVGDAFVAAFGFLPPAARDTVSLENPPAAAGAMPSADLMTLGRGAASSSSSSCVATATARCRTDRYGEAIEQAAQLASWEDEGGTASS